jgi:hypothetical protein
VILGGDGVHNGVQEITMKSMARRGPRGNHVTTTGGGWRLGHGGEIGSADKLIVYREKEGAVTLPGDGLEVHKIEIDRLVQREIEGRTELTAIIVGGQWSLRVCKLGCCDDLKFDNKFEVPVM